MVVEVFHDHSALSRDRLKAEFLNDGVVEWDIRLIKCKSMPFGWLASSTLMRRGDVGGEVEVNAGDDPDTAEIGVRIVVASSVSSWKSMSTVYARQQVGSSANRKGEALFEASA